LRKQSSHLHTKGASFFLVIFLVCCFFLNLSSSQEKIDKSRSFTLDNGLKVFLYEKSNIPLVNCVLAFNVGSKDETAETNGIVHILEHYILFRGTKFRKGEEISRDVRRHGAYFNAHTGRDLSIFEMTLPAEHIDFALRNQKEILFDLKFDQNALDKEKQVILEEISQMQDDPFKLASTLIFQNLFKDHPYHLPIYGKKEIIEAATTEVLEGFYRNFFVPENCALVVVGDISLADVEDKINNIFGSLQSTNFSPPKFDKIITLKKTVEINTEMDINIGYLAIGVSGPDYNSKDHYAMDILTEILGRGINPMLYNPLIKKRIFVNSMRMGYSAHKYGGSIFIYLALKPQQLKRAKKEIIRYLKQTRNLNFSPDDVFTDMQYYATDYEGSAKNRIRFNGERAQEKGLNLATSMARFMLMNEIPDRGVYLENLEKVSSSDLRETAGRYLSQKAYVIVTIKPLDKK